MNRKTFVIICALLMLLAGLFVLSCATKKTPTSTAPTATPTPTQTQTQIMASRYNFDSDLNGWKVSNYSDNNDGELGITSAEISTERKFAGAASARLTCEFEDDLGASKKAKGAFKIVFSTSSEDSSEDLRGKTISVYVYVPEALTQPPYKSNPYGAKVYIKTGSDWDWHDGGWNNLLTFGWNSFTFAPSGVGEEVTKEVGIQISKGTGTPNWTGAIYVDEINW